LGKKNKYKKSAIDRKQLETLHARFMESASAVIKTEEEWEALMGYLLDSEDVEGLGKLVPMANSKSRKKGLNKALYRLRKKGLEVPVVKQKPEPIMMSSQGGNGTLNLPVLMSPPHAEAVRIFFVPYQSGRTLWSLRMTFKEPIGLVLLEGSQTTRTLYKTMVSQVIQSAKRETLPSFILAEGSLGLRRLFEVRDSIRRGRVGSEVEHQVATLIKLPEEMPEHPILSLITENNEHPLPVSALVNHPSAVAPYMHSGLVRSLEERFKKAEEGVLVLSAAQKQEQLLEAEKEVVGSWLENWPEESLIELMLDSIYYHYKIGLHEISATLLQVYHTHSAAERTGEIESFILQLVRALRENSPDMEVSPEKSSGGIILT
jgi:hypothetical protein